MEHHLKTLQPYYDDVRNRKKTFEIRKNDRNFKVGDTLVLREYIKDVGYTGNLICRTVSYVLKDCPQYGLMDGYCILGLSERGRKV